MKRFWITVVALALLGNAMSVLITSEAASQDSFWTEVAQGNMTEVAAGNLAATHSQNDQVKQFAQQMVTDQTAAGTELQTLASSKNVTLPAAVSTKQQSELDKLGSKNGADFDRDFMKMMVKDHDKMAKLLDRESKQNTDADIKAFAAKTLPVVQGHLTAARSLNDSLKGSTSPSRSEMGSNSNRSNTSRSNSNRNSNSNSNSNSKSNSNSNSNNSNSNR
jgi:putative membrane protein